jgi:hypothetical protein
MKGGSAVHRIKCRGGWGMANGCCPVILQYNIISVLNSLIGKRSLTIARAHSFIMKGVSGTESEVTESMYV